jgi:hypothetical protein
MSPSSPQSNHTVGKSKTPQPPTFPLPEKPKSCWVREHMAPAKIERCTWTSLERSCNITRPYYICTTCGNATSDFCFVVPRLCGNATSDFALRFRGFAADAASVLLCGTASTAVTQLCGNAASDFCFAVTRVLLLWHWHTSRQS